jgi:hypothetical protein
MGSAQRKAVVVTTEHKGVFFGFTAGPLTGKTAELTDARMCLQWSEGVRGVLGLAATGPDRSSKVTRAVPRLALTEVTSMMDATPEAVDAWQDKRWS